MTENSQETIHIGKRLRALRLQCQKKLHEVAREAGITEGYLSRIELGTRQTLSAEVLKNLAAYFDVTEDWLLTGRENDPKELAKADLQRAIEDSGLQDRAEEVLAQLAIWLRFFIASDDAGRRAALPRVIEALEGFSDECAKGNARVREAGRMLARANFLHLNTETKVDISKVLEDGSSQMQRWLKLRARVKALLSTHGSKTDLAERLHVSRQMLHRYVEGNSAPNAEIALQMLEWVTAEEGKQKSPEGALTPPEPVTQKRKSDHEKPPPGRSPK